MIECKEKESWDAGLLAQSGSSFLQSWDWGEFQRAVGREPVRLQIVEGERVAALAQGLAQRLGLGWRYLYIPRSGNMEHETWNNVIKYGAEAGYCFVRIEPTAKLDVAGSMLHATTNIQPRRSLILDVSPDEGSLLAAMHPKTRYNIGVAERKGVVVRAGAEADIFWRLNRETIGRDRFRSHDRDYYEKMLASPLAHQLTAFFNDTPIAANILVHFGKTMTYLHGASSNVQRNLMAPYLLQWEGIQLAKRLGCNAYDFWGIAPRCQMSARTSFHGYEWEAAHPWTGVTRFKVGFGGEPVEYGQAVDVVLRPVLYKMYTAGRTIRQHIFR